MPPSGTRHRLVTEMVRGGRLSATTRHDGRAFRCCWSWVRFVRAEGDADRHGAGAGSNDGKTNPDSSSSEHRSARNNPAIRTTHTLSHNEATVVGSGSAAATDAVAPRDRLRTANPESLLLARTVLLRPQRRGGQGPAGEYYTSKPSATNVTRPSNAPHPQR